MLRILIAEDEPDLARAVQAVLIHQGYEVTVAADGLAAVEEAGKKSFDCMIFDIMMPRLDGIGALKQIRQKGDTTPVIMLTAKAEIDDRVEGLDAGADDYLTKPFSMKELLARIRSMTRRSSTFHSARLNLGSVSLDTETLELSARNAIRLSGKETELMEYLMRNPGKSFSTGELYERIWKAEEDGPEIVWVYISYLRQKLLSINADLQILGESGGSFMLKEQGSQGAEHRYPDRSSQGETFEGTEGSREENRI